MKLAFLLVAQLPAKAYKADWDSGGRRSIDFGQVRPVGAAMRHTLSIMLAALTLTLLTFAQEDVATFKAEATNALVWGEDSRAGAVSSSVDDPVTGSTIHRLKHAGIEVSSRAGFERVGSREVLSFTTTIVNTTKSEASVRPGGAMVEGHMALPLWVLTKKDRGKKEREQVVELASMRCFANGFLPHEEFFSPAGVAPALKVAPNQAMTVSFVTKDPRYSSMLCTAGGCYPKGTMRFSVVVNTTVFVFLWPGPTMVSCGS